MILVVYSASNSTSACVLRQLDNITKIDGVTSTATSITELAFSSLPGVFEFFLSKLTEENYVRVDASYNIAIIL